jgi:phosphatidylinositol alpha-1,6-mannosyltransferase
VRRRLGIVPDAPVVVCTARLVRRKGQDALIRAWPAVLDAHPGARLLLVGDGPDRRRLERMAVRRGLGSSVIFTGGVSWHEVPAYTDAGNVFAMPCRTRLLGLEPEAWGIVFLEAQACGLPVIIGRSGGAPETLLDPAGGEVLVGGHQELSEAILRRLHAGTARRRPEASLARWSWQQAAQRLSALWDQQVDVPS